MTAPGQGIAHDAHDVDEVDDGDEGKDHLGEEEDYGGCLDHHVVSLSGADGNVHREHRRDRA